MVYIFLAGYYIKNRFIVVHIISILQTVKLFFTLYFSFFLSYDMSSKRHTLNNPILKRVLRKRNAKADNSIYEEEDSKMKIVDKDIMVGYF